MEMKTAVPIKWSLKNNGLEAYFSTVHKAKGQEYAYVELDDTFITYDDVDQLNRSMKSDIERLGHVNPDLVAASQQMNEEINILYVAVTRAMARVKL